MFDCRHITLATDDIIFHRHAFEKECFLPSYLMFLIRIETILTKNGLWCRLPELCVKNIIESGLEPFKAPEPLLPIREEDIELLVWMGISSA